MYYLEFLPYEDAREFVRKQGSKNQKEWKGFSKSDRKPDYIPAAPHKVYRGKGWTNLADQEKEYLSFEEAREYARSLGLKTTEEWRSFTKSLSEK
jgi:hypothetical protein